MAKRIEIDRMIPTRYELELVRDMEADLTLCEFWKNYSPANGKREIMFTRMFTNHFARGVRALFSDGSDVTQKHVEAYVRGYKNAIIERMQYHGAPRFIELEQRAGRLSFPEVGCW